MFDFNFDIAPQEQDNKAKMECVKDLVAKTLQVCHLKETATLVLFLAVSSLLVSRN